MNEQFNDDDTKNITTQLSAWDMSRSVLAGLNQTITKAEVEYTAAVSNAQGNPRGPGVSTSAQLLESLKETLRGLEPDLRQIARASGKVL